MILLPEEIQTERLRLRPWTLEDVDAVLSYADDPEWSRYLHMLPSPYTREDAVRFPGARPSNGASRVTDTTGFSFKEVRRGRCRSHRQGVPTPKMAPCCR